MSGAPVGTLGGGDEDILGRDQRELERPVAMSRIVPVRLRDSPLIPARVSARPTIAVRSAELWLAI
jgi:hypothetical protein